MRGGRLPVGGGTLTKISVQQGPDAALLQGVEAMKIAPMREVRNNFAKYLETAEEEPVFVTKNGKITAVIEYVEDRSI